MFDRFLRTGVEHRVPVSLLTCQDAPAQPPENQTNRQHARWDAEVFDAGEDCRSKVERIRELDADWGKKP